jgi:hypothetical protein
MKRTALLALAICLPLGLAQYAFGAGVTIFSDNFESGNLNLWTTTTSTGFLLDDTKNGDPSWGRFSAHADLSVERMHRNIIGDNGGVEVAGASLLTAWIYDDSMTRAYVQALGYSGTGIPNRGTTADGTLNQLLAIGKYSSVTAPNETFDATKYQARVLYGSYAGWFNLNDPGAPSRSPGWHEFTIERDTDNTTIRFYVDDILSRTVTGSTAQSWDTITMGFGTASSSNGDAWYDGVSVVVPEPGPVALTLLGLGILVSWRRFRK